MISTANPSAVADRPPRKIDRQNLVHEITAQNISTLAERALTSKVPGSD